MEFSSILELEKKPLIGMVHLPPLRESLGFPDKQEALISSVLYDARILLKTGYDAILIENFNDYPYRKYRIEDELILMMALVAERIKKEIKLPLGINILRNACEQALTIAHVIGSSFIRCNVWEGAYVTDQGIIEGVAEAVNQKARNLNSNVLILADIHVKHATPLGHFSMVEAAKNALKRGKADAIVLSGTETGQIVEKSKLISFVNQSGIKPILGSGLAADNIETVIPLISGAIVGSSIKETDIYSPIAEEKARKLVEKWKKAR